MSCQVLLYCLSVTELFSGTLPVRVHIDVSFLRAGVLIRLRFQSHAEGIGSILPGSHVLSVDSGYSLT